MNILKKPVVSEKATLNELANCASFTKLTQELIRFKSKAVENSYNVTVLKVRTMIYGPSRKTKYTKTGGPKVKKCISEKSYC